MPNIGAWEVLKKVIDAVSLTSDSNNQQSSVTETNKSVQSISSGMSASGNDYGNLLQELQKSDLNALKKTRASFIQDAITQGVPTEHLLGEIVKLGQGQIPMGTVSATGTMPQQQELNNAFAGNPPQSAFPGMDVQTPKTFWQNLFQQTGLIKSKEGKVTGVKQGGLFDLGLLPTREALGLASSAQRLAGEEPMQRGSAEQLQLALGADITKENLKKQQESLQKSNVVKDDLANFVQSWNNIGLKGPFGLGGAGGVGRWAGFGRENYAKFEADAETLSYSFADFVLNQTNRSLTEKEREGIKKKIMGAGTSASQGEFLGKIQSIINSVNSRIRSKTPDAQVLPDARAFLKMARKKDKSQSKQVQTQVTIPVGSKGNALGIAFTREE